MTENDGFKLTRQRELIDCDLTTEIVDDDFKLTGEEIGTGSAAGLWLIDGDLCVGRVGANVAVQQFDKFEYVLDLIFGPKKLAQQLYQLLFADFLGEQIFHFQRRLGRHFM